VGGQDKCRIFFFNIYIYIWIDAYVKYIYIHKHLCGPWRFQPGPCVKPALVRPHTRPRSGRRRGCLCPPTHPPSCCCLLRLLCCAALRLPTAVLLSCYSYSQNLRRDGVEFILRVGLTTSRARERRGNIYIYISCLYISLYVYTYAFK
jgi:hypothetical protein